jgi:hypothetical protein
MSMPEIIRQYLRSFELRQELEDMRSLSLLRKLPRWFPLRDNLVRKKTRKMFLRSAAGLQISEAGAGNSLETDDVMCIANENEAEDQKRRAV